MHAEIKSIYKLEALREHRPPWPKQIIAPILPTGDKYSRGGDGLFCLPINFTKPPLPQP